AANPAASRMRPTHGRSGCRTVVAVVTSIELHTEHCMSHSCDLPATSETQNGEANKGRPLLVTLLPARNAAADLPGYLENVARFSDAVVALDDGSTDDTFDVLAAHPLVKILLRNPRREDYRGWDDAANRNRL